MLREEFWGVIGGILGRGFPPYKSKGYAIFMFQTAISDLDQKSRPGIALASNIGYLITEFPALSSSFDFADAPRLAGNILLADSCENALS